MRRLTAIEPVDATGRTRELLDEYAERGGKPGAMVLTMAQSPTMLRAYMDLSRTMKRSHIDRRIGERISIADRGASPPRLHRRADRGGAGAGRAQRADRHLQSHRRNPSQHDREECRVSDTAFLAWSAAVGAAGCGRCAAAA